MGHCWRGVCCWMNWSNVCSASLRESCDALQAAVSPDYRRERDRVIVSREREGGAQYVSMVFLTPLIHSI